MNIPELLEYQSKGYRKVHSARLNLMIHIIAVPFFVIGVLALVFSLINLSSVNAIASILTIILSFGAQGFGHSKEEFAAEPFSSPKQAVVRIFLEQFITFPKYVIFGGWYSAFKSSNKKP
ncbi:MAG: terminase [Oceanospirillaceae bacterium]|nr:terminase [Oceanospirillaceae bacterium]